ncbi:hypothetical protein D3C87_1973830 [compost metagenome]
MIAAETEAAADVQRAAWLVPRLGDFPEEIVKIAQQLLGPHPHPFTIVGQRDAPGGAVQQARRERGFQHGDAFADVGR